MKRSFGMVWLVGLTAFFSLNSFVADDQTGLTKDVFTETNLFRKSQGLVLLIMQEDLNLIAQKHSEDMASGRVDFGHDGFDNRYVLAGNKITGMHGFAENVALGTVSGKEVVTMWKNSSGHRANMMGQYRFIGIGIAKDKDGSIYYTQVFGG